MARVLCTLAFASELIDGIAFAAVDGGMLSVEISDSAALRLAEIPGFRLHEEGTQQPPQTPAAVTAPASDAAPLQSTEGGGEAAAHQPGKTSRRRAS